MRQWSKTVTRPIQPIGEWNSRIPNKLNDLDGKSWVKFTKSWFVHNPPPRGEDVVLHPAKFPETLVEEFIRFFTKQGQVVLDPMMGTGSTLVAAFNASRSAVGVELQEKYVKIGINRMEELIAGEQLSLYDDGGVTCNYNIIQGDARDIESFGIVGECDVDYVITSPPYWTVLRRKGAMIQQKRREKGLETYYSDDDRDVGNIVDYYEFISELAEIYIKVGRLLKPDGYMTIIVKNIKVKGKAYPLAWDLAVALDRNTYLVLKDERIWCQDNATLCPYGLGSAWVSNVHHHYVLQFRKE